MFSSNNAFAATATTTTTQTVRCGNNKDQACYVTQVNGETYNAGGGVLESTTTTTTTINDGGSTAGGGSQMAKAAGYNTQFADIEYLEANNIVVEKYAKIGTDKFGADKFLTNKEVKALPKTSVFFPSLADPNVGNGWIDASFFEDENGTHFICTSPIVITDYHEWLKVTTYMGNDADYSSYKMSVSPNPTNGNTTFSMEMLESANLSIALFDVNGNEVMKLHNGYTNAGAFSKTFIASNLTAGTYHVVCSIGNKTISVPFIVTK